MSEAELLKAGLLKAVASVESIPAPAATNELTRCGVSTSRRRASTRASILALVSTATSLRTVVMILMMEAAGSLAFASFVRTRRSSLECDASTSQMSRTAHPNLEPPLFGLNTRCKRNGLVANRRSLTSASCSLNARTVGLMKMSNNQRSYGALGPTTGTA